MYVSVFRSSAKIAIRTERTSSPESKAKQSSAAQPNPLHAHLASTKSPSKGGSSRIAFIVPSSSLTTWLESDSEGPERAHLYPCTAHAYSTARAGVCVLSCPYYSDEVCKEMEMLSPLSSVSQKCCSIYTIHNTRLQSSHLFQLLFLGRSDRSCSLLWETL